MAISTIKRLAVAQGFYSDDPGENIFFSPRSVPVIWLNISKMERIKKKKRIIPFVNRKPVKSAQAIRNASDARKNLCRIIVTGGKA